MKQHSIIALVLLGVMALGCTKEIPDQVGNDGTVIPGSTGDPVTLTTTVNLGGTPASKALTAAGKKTFAPGEQVAIVYTNTADATVKAVCESLTASDIRDDGKTATFSVTLTDPKASGAVSYIYPAAMAAADGSVNYAALSAQDGTLASLSAALDLAFFEGSLTASATLPDKVSLDNPLTIGEFTVSDGTSDITSSIVSFSVSAGADTYTVSRAAAAGPIYVAMKPVSGDLSFTAFDGGLVYEKAVTGKTMAAGSMYPVSISMTGTFNALATPLTFEAIEAGAQVSFRLPSNTEKGTVQYRVNDGAWTSYSSMAIITLESVGDKVQFRGKNDKYYVSSSDYGRFFCTVPCYLYGNVMSLVTDYSSDENAFRANKTLATSKTFYHLFEDVSSVRSHTSRPLVLPATTLTNWCYDHMFDGCTGLTTAPTLPATTLASGCYCSMFSDCTGLTTAPALPATTLASECYENMFGLCTGLTTAPALPATTLASECYEFMFSDCTGLTTAPALPATTLASHCYEGMFVRCTGLTTAPALPATQLANQCYMSMFNGCTNLSSVTCLATTFDSDATTDWLTGVASGGTFYKAEGVDWSGGDSGIPSGWTVVDYVAP